MTTLTTIAKLIQDDSMIHWIEPDDRDQSEVVVNAMCARDIVKLMKDEARSKNRPYPNDTDALWDFLVVNWISLEDCV